MNLICKLLGHKWSDCSSLQCKGNPRKDVWEVARRCKRKGCDKFETLWDEPYIGQDKFKKGDERLL